MVMITTHQSLLNQSNVLSLNLSLNQPTHQRLNQLIPLSQNLNKPMCLNLSPLSQHIRQSRHLSKLMPLTELTPYIRKVLKFTTKEKIRMSISQPQLNRMVTQTVKSNSQL